MSLRNKNGGFEIVDEYSMKTPQAGARVDC